MSDILFKGLNAIFSTTLVITIGLQPSYAEGAAVVISEFMSANDSSLQDTDGDYSDWIELYNPGAEAVRLEAYSLTDEPKNPGKWLLPDVTLDSDSRLVIFASGKDRVESTAELHTNFKLGVKGEYLALVNPGGKSVAHEFAPKYPDQKTDVSFGITDK